MNARIKVLGLGLVVVSVLSGLGASPVSANYNIKASSGVFSGGQVGTIVLTTDVGNVTCTSATFAGGQTSATASTLTVTPTYSGCKLSGVKVNATVAKGCTYEFETPTTTEPTGTTDANVDTCPSGGYILITDTVGLGCEIIIKPQTVGHVMFTNEAAGTVLAETTLKGIHYTWTKECPNSNTKDGTNTNGTETGNIRFFGFDTSLNTVSIAVT